MLSLLPGGRILVAVESVDGRKGIDSLAGVVRSVLRGDPLSGDLFVFKNRTGDKLKILAWMGDGYALYLRRLERGTFAFPSASDAGVLVTPTQLAMILGGLDPAKARERRRYKTPVRLALPGTRSGVEPRMPPTDDANDLRLKLSHAEAVIAELRGVVAELRKQVESQQAHIHRLVKITFGRGGERVEGPTLFDGMAIPEAEVPTPVEPPTREAPPATKRKGHGRRCKPKDLPRRREEIDLSEAEKVCACCGTVKSRIGQSTSERLDYQPMAIFVRELVRPTYACRSCESQGHDPQIARAVLPPEPIPKSGIGSGLLAHVIVSKVVDHLPLNRQESILSRHGWDVCRSTLCDHLQKCGVLLTPLYDLMHRRLLQSFAIHADDTPLLLLRPRRTAYAWLYRSRPVTLLMVPTSLASCCPKPYRRSLSVHNICMHRKWSVTVRRSRLDWSEPFGVLNSAASAHRSALGGSNCYLQRVCSLSMSEVSRILAAAERGDAHAAEALLPLVYEELRQLAAQRLAGEKPGQTLQPTALVHEAYVRLTAGKQPQDWNCRGHFFAAAAEAMRRILVEAARRKQCERHGGGRQRLTLDGLDVAAESPDDDLLALSEALDRLAEENPRAAELIKLRYFAGLTGREAAEALNISPRKADQVWAYARAWLLDSLNDDPL